MDDCDYAVSGAVAAARPVIGNTLRTSGSKAEAIKGDTRHLERRLETGFRKKKKKKVRFTQKCRLHKSAPRQE